MLNVIRQWVIKTMMKNNTGVVQTLPKRDLIELNTQITAQRLMQNGIDPQSLKNVNQVENVVNQIDNPPKINIDTGRNQSGIRSTKSAKVMDMEGKEIKDPKNIMGGKEINQQTLNDELMKTDNPYSDLTNTPRPKTIKEREAEVLAGMEKNNKEAVQRIRNRKMLDDAIDNASPGFVKGDRKYNAQLVADDLAEKKFGKDFYDLDQNQQLDLYGEALDGLSDSKNLERQFFKDVDEAGGMEEFLKKNPIDDPEDMAQGGRAGFRLGSGKGIMEFFKNMIKPRKPKVFDEKRFREGPIDLKFLENIDKKDLAPFIRSRDTMGPGGYGMYDDFADMPAGLRAAELIKTIKGPRNEINYKAAELFLGKKLKGNESADELIQMLNRQEMRADGGRAGFKDGLTPSFEDYLKERGMIEKRENLERLMREYQEDMRRKKVMEQKQMVAEGGRIGFKDGMTRRSFLKILGGLATIPIVGKFLKPIKTAKGIKNIPIIKTDNVAGKPEWFDALVNKVIIEGDDVTKKFATGERQSIHQKTLDDGSVVRVTEDVDDGAVRVEYDSDANVFEDTVQMEYKKPLPDEGAPNPAAEFSTAESGPVGRSQGPDDFDIDVDEVGGTSIRDLDSDVSKLKEYATGKGPTMKEFIQNKKRKDRAKQITEDSEAQVDAVIRRQGDADPSYYGDPEELASGGIARMLGE